MTNQLDFTNNQELINQLNNSLEIVKVDNCVDFRVDDNTRVSFKKPQWCLFIKGFGYVAFKKDDTPYNPIGGKKALQSMIQSGGFVHYGDIKFMNPIV